MILSMTGYGRARRGAGGGGLSVEIRSLNHRYFDFSLKVPPSLYGLEDRVRDFLRRSVPRGKVTVNISEKNASHLETLALDEKMIRFYLGSFRKLQHRFHLRDSLDLGDLLNLPRIFSVEKKEESSEALWRRIRPALEQALKGLLASKRQEGKALSKELFSRIRKMEKGLLEIEKRALARPQVHYEALRSKVKALFKNQTLDPNRVWQEAVFLAEKSDVSEEITRLRSHLRLFREKMTRGGEVGKELDFITQEMNREINTLNAKVQDFEISKKGVGIRAELEKIREQIQNIE